ncbi:hypothetical protein [Roseobacter sp. MH60115]|uniref:hypothetical protein n=1 Tax=Roseobacter sp. MH60115 TaxID=2785324 RepID=UPI0018A32AA4|nr:hypothetical protein [Roseobacter sp. MH60115]
MNSISTPIPARLKTDGGVKPLQPLTLVVEMLAPMALFVGVVLIIQIDVRFLGNGLRENSMTELSQSALLIFSAKVFAMRACQDVGSRGYLILVATLFACMFVRENDGFLDHIRHGFWVFPAMCVAIAGGLSALHCRDSIVIPFLRHFEQRETTYIFIGLLVVLVFSRLFGTTSLWQPLMADAYDASFKTVVQEGLELLGYALIAYGSARLSARQLAQAG